MQYPNSYCFICNRGFSVLNQNKIFICHITEMYRLLGQKINPGVRKCEMKNKRIQYIWQLLQHCNDIPNQN